MHLIDYDELVIISEDQQEYYYDSFEELQLQYSQNEVLSKLANR